jgi:quinol monooxygenase YgiN
MTAVYVLARVTGQPNRVAELRVLLLELEEESRREDGCLRYEVLQDEQDQNSFALVEEWQSASALDAHNASAHVRDALGRAPALVAQLPEIRRYRKLV